MLSLILSPALAKSADNLDVSVSVLFEEIKAKPVELRHFCKTFPRAAIYTATSLVQFTESYLAIALERDLCVNLESKILLKPPCDPVKSPLLRSVLDKRMNSASKTSIT